MVILMQEPVHFDSLTGREPGSFWVLLKIHNSDTYLT